MDTALIIPIIAALLPPIIAGIVGVISSRIGIAGRIRELEYYQKRLELINALVTAKADYETNEHIMKNWSTLEHEIIEVLQFIQASSHERRNKQAFAAQENRNKFMKYIILPRPLSVGGWVATVIYYLYAFSAVSYFIFLFYPPIPYADPHIARLIPFGVLGSISLSAIARYFALKSWRKRQLVTVNTKNTA